MGAIAAAFTRNGLAAETVSSMLESMRHRAHNGFGLATESWATYSAERFPSGLPPADIGAGCCRSNILQQDLIQPFLTSAATAAVDGHVYGLSAVDTFDFVTQISASAPTCLPPIWDGSYAQTLIANHRLIASTDSAGLKPLYVGRTDGGFACASELRALRRIQARGIRKALPNEVFVIGTSAELRIFRRRIRIPRPMQMEFEPCARQLLTVLRAGMRLLLSDTNEACVAFSGGLDSAITAWLAEDAGCRVRLVSVGLREEPEELAHAETVANEMGWPIETFVYERDRVEEYVRRVLWLIEEPNLMKVSVAVPLHWSAESASVRGATILLTGQGSDELFGGYRKFSRVLDTHGPSALRHTLEQAVLNSHNVNFARDEKAVGSFPVELRSPFTTRKVIDFGLGIPVEFKIRAGDDLMRKWILRRVGNLMKLPRSVTERRKRAIQHATGVEQAIRNLASHAGKNPESYLADLDSELQRLHTMP